MAGPSDPPQPFLARASRLLGLPAAGSQGRPIEVEDVEVDRRVWRFRLGGTSVAAFTLRIEAPSDACFCRTAHLAFSYDGDVGPVGQEVVRRLAQRLKDVTVDHLARLFGEGLPPPPETVVDREPVPDPGAAAGTGDDLGAWPGLHRCWDRPDAWRHFLGDEEASQERSTAIDFGVSTVVVQHGPIDCRYLCPRGFLEIPWRDPSGGAQEVYLRTAVDETDVITGSSHLLADALAEARRRTPRMVLVHSACIPQLIGDDIEGILDDERAAVPYPIFHSGSKGDASAEKYWTAVLDRALEDAPSSEAVARAVNLVGFRGGPGLDELVELLAARDVEVNAVLLPRLDLARAGRLRRATVHVCLPDRRWDAVRTGPLARLGGTWIEPTPPYGIEGTLAFLGAVGDALGDPKLGGRARKDAAGLIADAYAPLAAQARGLRVGVVCEPSTLGVLREPGRLSGIPMVAVLEEMGFEVHVGVAHTLDAPLPPADADWLQARAGWAVLRSASDLGAWLRDGRIRALYSAFFFESRAVEAGVAPFSLRVFEPGLDGAVRTLRRLVRRCTTPYYRDYGRLSRVEWRDG